MHENNKKISPLVINENNKLTVLVVEDNEINQKLIMLMLEDFGYEVCIAGNGKQGVDAYKNGTFDLILMDIQMPVMDGFMATLKIRSLEKKTGRHVPIIAVTAHSMPGYKKKCLQAGMDNYLAKPYSIDALHNIIIKTIKACA